MTKDHHNGGDIPESDDSYRKKIYYEQNGQRDTLHAMVPPAQNEIGMTRQERAQRYLERKRIRQEYLSLPLPVTKSPVVFEDQIAALSTTYAHITPTSVAGQDDEFSTSASVTKVHARRRRWRRKIMLRRLSRRGLRLARVDRQQSVQRFWTMIGSIALVLLALFVSLTGVGAFFAYRFYNQTYGQYAGSVLTLRDLVPRDNLKMYDSKNVLIAQMMDQGLHTSVSYQDVAPDLVKAVVATEDKNFWENSGVDLARIIQAAVDDLSRGRIVAGGSTITQQLIKNLVVGDDSTITRKLQEILLVPALNSRYSKDDIMEMYLNSIFYGEQAYGIDAAATIYFGLEDQPGKPAAKQLDLAQSAMLAGLPALPSVYDPLRHPAAAFNRFQDVLSFMQREGYISRQQVLNALDEAQRPHFFKAPTSLVNRAPHFAEFVYTQLEHSFHMTRQQLSRSDMRVYTTLDIALQDQIQKIAQQHIAALSASNHLTNAAEVLIDFHTGAIRSLLGSIDYNNTSIDGQFDVATQAYRQPGSSFKPYVYVTAFEQGASPAQAISDEPTTIILPPGSDPATFTPQNYDDSFHGHMTIRCALQNSLNVPAVRTLQQVGIDAAMSTAQDMGIASYQGTPGYSLVLGGLGVRLIDHTSAYGTFANGGVHVPYYVIEKVTMGNTPQTYGHPANAGQRVLSPQIAYMMTNVLSDNTSRLPEFYDCNVLQLYSNTQDACWYGNRGDVRPAAAKTGTTNDFHDNWTIGYTTDYVMGVWAGNDDNTPMYNITGVQGAAPIWHDAMLVAEKGHPIQNFVNPGGLAREQVTYPDGVKTIDWFLPGSVPTFTLPGPTPEPTRTATLLPTPGRNTPARTVVLPYCPGDFSYAFTPPANGVPSPTPGWW